MKKGKLEDKERVLAILTESFKDNLSVQYVAGNNPKKIRRLIEYSFFNALKFGSIFFDDEYTACCLLIDPKKKRTTLGSIIWDLRLLFGVIGLFRLTKVLKKEKIVSENHSSTDHIHLWYIGVLPEFQGKGKGKQLIEFLKNYYEEPLYLETSMDSNIAFYKSCGFELYSSCDFGFTMSMFRYIR